MRRKEHGQASSEYLVIGAVALVVTLVAVVLVSSFSSKGASEVESRIYWQGAAKPIRIKDAVSLYGSVCDTPSTGGYRLALENSEVDSITLTGVNVDGVGREFCNEGRAPASSIPMGANDQAVVGIPVVEGASPCQEGQFVSMEIAFVYNKRYLSGHVQNGTKALVFKCNTAPVAGENGGKQANETPACSPSGASCATRSCCAGFVCNAQALCQACMRIGERTCGSDSDCCAGAYCTNGMCIGCRPNQDACSPPGFGIAGGCCSSICGNDNKCCVDNYHYSSNAQCSSDGDCCAGLKCNSDRECLPCGNGGAQCIDARDCCSGMVCGAQSTCMVCKASGEECIDSFDCCGGLSCNENGKMKTCGDQNVENNCMSEGETGCCTGYECPEAGTVCCKGLACGSNGEITICQQAAVAECRLNGILCKQNSECCSTYCIGGACSLCAGENEACDGKTPCCEGFACSAEAGGKCVAG